MVIIYIRMLVILLLAGQDILTIYIHISYVTYLNYIVYGVSFHHILSLSLSLSKRGH